MQPIKYYSIVLLLLYTAKLSDGSDCEICDLNDQLSETERQLSDCKSKLNDNSYLGQVCSRVGSWFTKDTSLKSTVSKLLDKLNVLSNPSVQNIEKDVVIRLTAEDLNCLKKFVTEENGNSDHVENILLNSMTVRETILDKTTDFLSSTITQTSLHFKANYVIVFQVLVLLFFVVLPLALGAPKIPVFLFMCLYTVFTNWVKLYYTVAAKKQATLAKHSNVPYACRIEQQGWAAAVGDFVSGLFNGKRDPCEDYYTAAMVDPAWEVGLVAALMETLSSCIIIPAQSLGTALGSFYHNLLEPLPWVWKVPILIVATIVILFLLLLLSGYEFSIPFLLRICPGQQKKRKRKSSDSDDDHLQRDRISDGPRNYVNHNGMSAGWNELIFERHPSEEYDQADSRNSLPYPIS